MTLPRALYDELLAEARRALPLECCGLLGGHGRSATRLFRAANAHASPTAYEISPRELFALLRRLREERLDLAGIYHSHPTGDNRPSARDSERAYYPETPYVIVSPRPEAPQPVRAFLLGESPATELVVEVRG